MAVTILALHGSVTAFEEEIVPRKRKVERKRHEYSEAVVRLMEDGDYSGDLEAFLIAGSEEQMQQAWEDLRDEVMERWIRERPGQRPMGWWLFDAPREAMPEGIPEWVAKRMTGARQRLGGKGTPCHEVLNVAPSFRFGVPDYWVSSFEEEYYSGRAKDIHGNRIGMEYQEGHFKGVAIDVDDPPIFESEPSFLKRHGLFFPGEEERIPPEAWEPERVEIGGDEKLEPGCGKNGGMKNGC
jgi:hypothetical protein